MAIEEPWERTSPALPGAARVCVVQLITDCSPLPCATGPEPAGANAGPPPPRGRELMCGTPRRSQREEVKSKMVAGEFTSRGSNLNPSATYTMQGWACGPPCNLTSSGADSSLFRSPRALGVTYQSVKREEQEDVQHLVRWSQHAIIAAASGCSVFLFNDKAVSLLLRKTVGLLSHFSQEQTSTTAQQSNQPTLNHFIQRLL